MLILEQNCRSVSPSFGQKSLNFPIRLMRVATKRGFWKKVEKSLSLNAEGHIGVPFVSISGQLRGANGGKQTS